MARRQTQGKQPAPPEQRVERPVPLVPNASDSVVTHFVPVAAQIAEEEAARNALAEEDAARLLELALANTDADSDAAWDGLGYAFASQDVLAELWLTPEEDAAWQYLRKEM